MAGLDEFDRKFLRERERKLKRHSAQIGRLCVIWSSLELDVVHVLIAVAPQPDPAVKNVLMGMMDFRKKLHALLALGFKKKPNDDWFTDLSKSINTIDTRLRTERNRMVHDFWFTVPDEAGNEVMNRVHMNPKVVNEQSRTQKLQLANLKPVTPKEISDLCEAIVHENLTMIRLRREFELSPFRDKPPPLNRLLNPSGDQTA